MKPTKGSKKKMALLEAKVKAGKFVTRKEMRKARRKGKFLTADAAKKAINEEKEQKVPVNDQKQKKNVEKVLKQRTSIQMKAKLRQIEDDEKEKQKLEKLQEDMRRQRIRNLRKDNKVEDKVIKQLEKKLYIKKKKKANHIPKSFIIDGLDFLLEACDPEKFKEDLEKHQIWNDESESSESDDNDAPEEIARKSKKRPINTKKESDESTSKKKQKTVQFDVEENEDSNNDEIDEDLSNDEIDEGLSEDEIDDEDLSNDEIGDENMSDDDENESEQSDDDEINQISETALENKTKNEDHKLKEEVSEVKHPAEERKPEGRVSMLKIGTGENDKEKRLKMQIRGFLNRLSESNMHKISSELEEVYRCNSQNIANTTLTTLVLDFIHRSAAPERLLIEQAFLFSILHANIGTEVGAYFLQVLAEKFNCLLENLAQNKDESKEIDNLLVLICHLYSFGVTSSVLIFDIVKKLTNAISEKTLDLILLVLRNVGLSLRKDDTALLRDTVQEIQLKAKGAQDTSSRFDFMLEVINAVKNNNIQKIPNYDPTYVEHLKKTRKQYIHEGCYVNELKISLDDLLKVKERGRWWVVGSAWTGVLPGEKPPTQQNNITSKTNSQSTMNLSDEILESAQKLRMNTDLRKKIFALTLTAEDYIEASEVLLQLGGTQQQQQEVCRILIDICTQESPYNPYYTRIIQRLCDTAKNYKGILRFCLHEKIDAVQRLEEFQISNLSHIVVELLLSDTIRMAVLTVISFVDMTVNVKFFMKKILKTILAAEDGICKEVFSSLGNGKKSRTFREGLIVFMERFVKTKKLHNKIQIARNAMAMGDKSFRL